MTHGSLFSGIGGFDLAAQWMGWQNLFHCEKNSQCQALLAKRFPCSFTYNDVTTFPSSIWNGKIDVLSGGFPCQPFSDAGKRQGTNDSRYLWPAMLDVVRGAKPKWVVGENVYGLVSWHAGEVLNAICLDLEAEGYTVWPLVLPATAFGAPHQRDRIWFVARKNDPHANSVRAPHPAQEHQPRQPAPISSQKEPYHGRCPGDHSNPNEQKHHKKQFIQKPISDGSLWRRPWIEVAARLCRMDDGLPRWVVRHRSRRFKQLGNAIVPQIAYAIFKAIEAVEQSTPQNQ